MYNPSSGSSPKYGQRLVRFGSKADMCGAQAHVSFGPKADMAMQTEKTVLAAVSPNFDVCFAHAANAAAFFFLRHPINPSAPKPVANSGSAAGSGVAAGEISVSAKRPKPFGSGYAWF
jgi:hypothetical protein